MRHFTVIWLSLAVYTAQASTVDYSTYPEVIRLQKYVQINTTTGGDLQPAVNFWRDLAAEQDVCFTELELVPGCPIVILEWPGSDPTLQTVMLNSHMDVVPAHESEGWTYPPFSGHLTSDGIIWGRGTQDTKSVGIQYYEALSRLKKKGEKLTRTVYMTLMPDEEVGAECGMIPFLESKEFAALNVGVELDEGTSYPVPFIPVFYQDKVVWQLRVSKDGLSRFVDGWMDDGDGKFHGRYCASDVKPSVPVVFNEIQVDCYGVAAHGSTFPPTNSTATGKCRNVINTLLDFREEQYKISTTASITNAGVYTSVNLNKVNSGTANNVIPNHMSAVFDIRLGTQVNEEKFSKQISDWIASAGTNITLTYILKNKQSPATRIDDTNPYWKAIASAAKDLNITVVPIVPPGSTDARFVRGAGIPAFGFSPMPNTELLLHAVNEHLSADTFLDGIRIYEGIIKNIANLSKDEVGTDPSTYVYSTNNN